MNRWNAQRALLVQVLLDIYIPGRLVAVRLGPTLASRRNFICYGLCGAVQTHYCLCLYCQTFLAKPNTAVGVVSRPGRSFQWLAFRQYSSEGSSILDRSILPNPVRASASDSAIFLLLPERSWASGRRVMWNSRRAINIVSNSGHFRVDYITLNPVSGSWGKSVSSLIYYGDEVLRPDRLTFCEWIFRGRGSSCGLYGKGRTF